MSPRWMTRERGRPTSGDSDVAGAREQASPGPATVGPRFAARVAGIPGSVIDSSTSLLQAQEHDVVRFAMGSPAPEAIPSDALAAIATEALSAAHGDAYGYGPTEGEAALRASLRDFLEQTDGRAPAPESLLITSGGMQGLDLACKLFVDPGDPVAVESPTYTNGTAVITSYGGRVLEVPTDRHGLDVDALAGLVGVGVAPKLIYAIPNFQNPSGTTLSLPRRERLIELAERWGAVILEDDPYRLLRFRGESLPSLEEIARGRARVVGVHTFSKILAPGLRVGWVTAEPEVISRMIDAKQGLDTCTNVPMQRLIARFLAAGLMTDHLARIRGEYRRRKLAMEAALDRHFDGITIDSTDPDGGFFLWLTLPGNVDTEKLFPLALEAGVAFIPGPAFSAGGRFRNALRLCFASTGGERTEVGIGRLRAAIDRYLAEGEGQKGRRF
jgi:2-aminoadipate transaminase